MNPVNDAGRVIMVNTAAVATSAFTNIEPALRVAVLLASLVYTIFQIAKLFREDASGKSTKGKGKK